MKVGNVIVNKSGKHVITRITNGVVTETVELERYIIKNAMVMVGDEWVTLESIINQRCDMYLKSGIEIING